MSVDSKTFAKLTGKAVGVAKIPLLVFRKDGVVQFRCSGYSSDVVCLGHTYRKGAIPRIQVPSRVARREPVIRVEMENVSLEIKRALHASRSARWTFDLFHVMSDAPDVKFESYLGYHIQSDSSNPQSLSIESKPFSVTGRAMVTYVFDPATTPAAMAA